MEKRPVVYKRRPKKPPSEVPVEAVDAEEDSGPQESDVVVSHEDGTESIIGPKERRKSWLDRSLSNKGRRRSVSSGQEFNISGMAQKWIGTLFGRKDQNRDPGVHQNLREQLNKTPAVPNESDRLSVPSGDEIKSYCNSPSSNDGYLQGRRSKRLNPPVEFVNEKRAMFAEIDSYELESEEESPVSKPRSQEWVMEYCDISKGVHSRKCNLEIVPEDDFEELADSLSVALRTPDFFFAQSDCLETSSKLSSSRDNDASLVPRNLSLDTGNHSLLGPSTSIDESANNQHISNSDASDRKIAFDDKAGRFLPMGANEAKAPPVCDSLVSRLQSLQIGVGVQIPDGGKNLNSLAEVDEEEDFISIQSNETKDRGSFRNSGEILLQTSAQDLLPIFEALLEECQQTRPLTFQEAISDICDLSEIVKLGEGTFGEAFKGGGCVFKIVPMDGDFLVNGEVQKTSAEIYSEVLLTNTLAHLRGGNSHDSIKNSNCCANFIETKAIRICQGRYEQELCLAWEQWDAVRTSDNDHPMLFPQDQQSMPMTLLSVNSVQPLMTVREQLYVVFVLADGGNDLETFVLSDFSEVRSVLLQVVLALAVAEEGCGFEHRDLHWGNIVLARDQHKYGQYRLLDKDLKVRTFGVSVSIIDFTLSRIDTGNHVFFCNLSSDPTIFEGPSKDTQSDTYRRMLHLTKGNWEGSFPQTNCYWVHYLADVLLSKKSYLCSYQEKRVLRSFRKRVLLYETAKAAVSDSFFDDMWISSE